jgi:hypothetical protein
VLGQVAKAKNLYCTRKNKNKRSMKHTPTVIADVPATHKDTAEYSLPAGYPGGYPGRERAISKHKDSPTSNNQIIVHVFSFSLDPAKERTAPCVKQNTNKVKRQTEPPK